MVFLEMVRTFALKAATLEVSQLKQDLAVSQGQQEEARQEKEKQDRATEKARVDEELRQMAERLEETSERLRAEEAQKAHTARLVDRLHEVERELVPITVLKHDIAHFIARKGSMPRLTRGIARLG